MHLPNLSTILISLALIATGVSAQDQGTGYVFKCTTPGEVALTFDDGPSPFTAKLLGYLAKEQVPATFFVLGKSVNEPGGKEALKATFDAGHQIALHSNTHSDMNTLTPAAIKDEYTQNIKAVVDTIGLAPTMARPPFGNCNAACAKVLQGEMNLSIIQWNCDSNDWRFETTPADQPKTFSNIADIINPSNPKTDSFITLQHDIKDYSVEYVPQIIQLIKGKGYTFVTVEKCVGGTAYAKGGNTKAAAAPAKEAPAKEAPAKEAPAKEAKKAPAAPPAAKVVEGPGPEYASASAAPAAGATKPAGNSADKVASTFGLTFIGLISALLMN